MRIDLLLLYHLLLEPEGTVWKLLHTETAGVGNCGIFEWKNLTYAAEEVIHFTWSADWTAHVHPVWMWQGWASWLPAHNPCKVGIPRLRLYSNPVNKDLLLYSERWNLDVLTELTLQQLFLSFIQMPFINLHIAKTSLQNIQLYTSQTSN